MNRRGFLSSLLPAAIVLTDPEELLWKPLKAIFIPPAPKMFSVDMDFSHAEMALSMDDFRERYIKPAVQYYLAHDGLWEFNGKETRLLTEMQDIEFELRKGYPDAR